MLDKKLGNAQVRTLLIRIEAHEFHIGAVRRGFGRYSSFVRFFQVIIVVFEYGPHLENVYDLANKLRRIRATTENVRVLPAKSPIMATTNSVLDKVRVNAFPVVPVSGEITQH